MPRFRDPYETVPRGAAARCRRGGARAGRAALITAYIDRRWPGPRASAVRRTAMIDAARARCGGRRLRAAVILGAGYDARAHRMPELTGVDVFEVDLPSTQARKRAVMGDGRVRYVGDL